MSASRNHANRVAFGLLPAELVGHRHAKGDRLLLLDGARAVIILLVIVVVASTQRYRCSFATETALALKLAQGGTLPSAGLCTRLVLFAGRVCVPLYLVIVALFDELLVAKS